MPNINDHGTEFMIMHAGFHHMLPPYHYSKGHDWKCETIVSTGSVVEQILKVTEDRPRSHRHGDPESSRIFICPS